MGEPRRTDDDADLGLSGPVGLTLLLAGACILVVGGLLFYAAHTFTSTVRPFRDEARNARSGGDRGGVRRTDDSTSRP